MAKPTFLSRVPATTDIDEARIGARMLGFPLTPQGEIVARVCQATGRDGLPKFRQVAVQIPRRATKTTTLTAIALGRMVSRPDYRVISTAQTGDIARRMFREMVMLVDLGYADVDAEDRPYKVRIANGTEELRWSNGSTWRPVTPSPLSYRSAAADLLIFEEAGHIAPELALELRAGAFPTQDTRPAPQRWIVGTPNERSRAGMLWDALVAGRERRAGQGIVDYCLTDEETYVNEDGTLNEKLVRRVHPGPSTKLESGRVLTPMAVLREHFENMPLSSFEAEYGGKWAVDGMSGAIPMPLWEAAAREVRPTIPDRYAWAYCVTPEGSAAAVVAAWRTDDGQAHVELLKHAPGVDWLPEFVQGGYRKNRTPIGYESIGANIAPAEMLGRLRNPRPVAEAMPFRSGLVPAEQHFVTELSGGRVEHTDQPALTAAVRAARWRSTEGQRVWGWKVSGGDISPAVAAALALYRWDRKPQVGGSGLAGMFE